MRRMLMEENTHRGRSKCNDEKRKKKKLDITGRMCCWSSIGGEEGATMVGKETGGHWVKGKSS